MPMCMHVHVIQYVDLHSYLTYRGDSITDTEFKLEKNKTQKKFLFN